MRKNTMYQFERIFNKKPAIAAFILSILIVSSLSSFMPLVAEGASAPATLSLKFNVAPKNTGSLIGALAAKLVPNSVGLQIVVTGGSSANDVDNTNSHGSITCLNGTNGNIIWQVDGYPVSIHQPFQIADLYNDGNYKIIVSLWDKTLVLNGNDGSVNWTSIAPSGNVLPAIADVNGDGYPEIFVASGNGPYRGSDWITMLSHDGTILHQAYTWHPCYGGVTVGDPNGDGKFVLFSSDRSYTYAADNDTYKGGGFGIRAFDAETLTPLWDYPIFTSSSHVPILADVNQDGKLDVIVGDQESMGIQVLNAADGTVLGGRAGSTNMPVHLQPTVGDLDRDGHLEFLANNASQPKIWDLYSWESKGALFDELGQPLIAEEPPKVGNVMGGSFPDIIASAWSSLSNPYANQRNKVYIYEYNSGSRNYAIVAVLSNISNSPNNFSLVADVDGDGKNELVLTGGGRVYAYGTSVPVPAKPARSNLQFYSESNRGVAEYVAPPIPAQPVLKQEQPAYDSTNQPVSPTLSIKVVDYQKQSLTITFSTDASGTWRNIQTFPNVQSGVYSVSSMNMGMNSYGTTYNWRVSVTNNKGATTTGNYRFTTYVPSPSQSTPTLVQNAGASGKDLRATTTSTSSKGPTTNIYSWYRNGTSLANLQLPFDTRTSTNPLVPSNFLNDDFENGLGNWNLADGNWRLTTSQAHSGSNSIQAYNGGYYLTSKPLDLSNTESVTISFWYRTHGSPEVYFTLWNGKWNDYLINLGSSSHSDEWQYYSVQTYDRRYLNSTFKLGFDAVGLDKIPMTDQQNIWIDDFQISTTTKTKDYSENGLNATVHGATWIRQGLVGSAYSFNGINNWISVPNTPLLDGKGTWSEMTAEFWVNPSKLQNGASLLAKKVASARTGSYMIGFKGSGSSNTLYWGITSTVDNQWHELSASALSVNKWSFVVCTYKSGQGLTVYVNGVQVANLPLTGNIALGPDPFAPSTSVFGQPLFIGGDGTFNPNSWFAGLIDEVKVYPTALTTAQVLQQYNDAADGASDDSIISSSQINTGEVWYSKVTPNDSFSDGLPKLTNAIRVGYSSAMLNLTVSSSHGNPNPGIGVTAQNFGSLITATVAGTAVENGVTWTCTGWTGTGSVPSSGTDASITFTIAADSTITWNWVQASSPSPNSPDTPNPNSVVATPTFSPPSGTYSSAQSVSITCSTSSSTIRYTTNGEEPTSSSTLYAGPILVTNGTVTIKAKAFASGLKESSAASATYTIEKSSLKLTVNSAHGNPTPSNTSYSSGQLITLNISSPITEDGTTWTCTGWTGTGSVPPTGSDTSVTFTITQDSTITWNWTSSAASDQTMYVYIAITVATLFILTVAGLLLKRRFK